MPENIENIDKYLIRKGFVLHHTDWYIKGFVYVKPTLNKFEIKTVSVNNSSMFCGLNDEEFSEYLKYLKHFL